MAPLWNADPESLLATPGNYASSGQIAMAKAMMGSLSSDQKNLRPMIARSQMVAHMLDSLGEAGWGNIYANLANKQVRGAGQAAGNYAVGDEGNPQPPIADQGQNTGSVARSPIPQGNVQQTGSLGSDASQPDYFREQAKRSENEPLYIGKQKTSKAAMDVDKYRNGFGTNSTGNSPTEVIDAPTAHARFNAEWDKSNARVKARYPNVDYGSQQAMTSLDHNGGPGMYMGKGIDRMMQLYNNTGDPKALEAAKQAFLQYNQTAGAYSKGLQNRRNREVNWFGQKGPEQPTANPTAAVQSGLPGTSVANTEAPPMHLGGEVPHADVDKEEADFAKNQRVAQNTQGVAARTTPAGAPIQQTPGYTGPMPSTGYAASKDAMKRLMQEPFFVEHPEIAQKYMENWQKRTDPQYRQTHGGMIETIPNQGSAGGTSQFLPMGEGTDIGLGAGSAHITAKTFPKMDAQGNVTYGTNLPGQTVGGQGGGSTDDLGGATSIMKGLQRVSREGAANEDILKEQTGTGSDLAKQGVAAGNSIRNLNEMKTVVDTLDTDTGPTAPNAIKIKEMLMNFAPEWSKAHGLDAPGLAGSELMDKLNTYFASEATKSFNSRGTNFDLQTFMRSFPGNAQSKEGTQALINMLQQEFEAKREIGLKAGSLTAEDYSKDPNAVANMIKNHYKENPIKMTFGGEVHHAQIYDTPAEAKQHVKIGEHFLFKNPKTGGVETRERTQ